MSDETRPPSASQQPAPEEIPGHPRRDHTQAPSELDAEESRLPEGPQPPKPAKRLSWVILSIVLLAAVGVGLIGYLTGVEDPNIPAAIGVAVAAAIIGTMPLFVAIYLRRRELRRMNA
jgi:hypothetical protein